MEQAYEVPISEYWRILKKRRATIVLVFAVVVMATVVFTRMQTPVYQAAIDLKVERTASPSGKEGMGGTVKVDDLETELHLFKSLAMMAKVVEKVEVLPVDPARRCRPICPQPCIPP